MSNNDAALKKKKKNNAFDPDNPVTDLVEAIDYIFKKMDMTDSIFRNPSYKSDSFEKYSGLTNTYLMPIRIGRKAIIGNTVLYYGRKINLFPEPYEVVSFDAPADIYLFFKERIKDSMVDYMSIQSGHHQLNLDIRDGNVVFVQKIGFDDIFQSFAKNSVFTIGDLSEIISHLLAA